jgi:hypothetical protein
VSKNEVNALPECYDENMIGFFSQGPDVAFVYWEFSAGQWEMVAERGNVCVRLYKVRETESSDYEYILIRETEPPPYTNNWYFYGIEPNSTYIAEIGCRLPDGSFFPLVKSETMATPPVPRFDAMPRPRGIADRPAVPVREHRPAEGQEKIAGTGMEMADVYASMPFYMGYYIK